MIVSGIRADDMAVRMKYAGVEPDRIICEPKLSVRSSKRLMTLVLTKRSGFCLLIPAFWNCKKSLRAWASHCLGLNN